MRIEKQPDVCPVPSFIRHSAGMEAGVVIDNLRQPSRTSGVRQVGVIRRQRLTNLDSGRRQLLAACVVNVIHGLSSRPPACDTAVPHTGAQPSLQAAAQPSLRSRLGDDL